MATSVIPKGRTTPTRPSSILQALTLAGRDALSCQQIENMSLMSSLSQEIAGLNGIITALTFTADENSPNSANIADNTAQIATKLPKAVTVNTDTRELDVPFQISTTLPSLVFYTVELSVTYSLLSSQTETVDLMCDSIPTPTTSQGQAYLSGNQGLGLSITQTVKSRQQLVAYAPAGSYVSLVSSGTGSATLISQLELIFY